MAYKLYGNLGKYPIHTNNTLISVNHCSIQTNGTFSASVYNCYEHCTVKYGTNRQWEQYLLNTCNDDIAT